MYIELKTDRLLLRPLDIKDLDTVHSYASDLENTRYMLFLPNDTKKETENFLIRVSKEWQKDEPGFFEFAITLEGKQIGAVSITLNEERSEGELGWILNKNHWGRGYATEAALAVRDFAENELKVKSIIAHCDHRNKASFELMKRIGMVMVDDSGTRRNIKTGETARELMFSTEIPGE